MFDRTSYLIGLMFKTFPKLREDQILDYEPEEMEELLTDAGVSIEPED